MMLIIEPGKLYRTLIKLWPLDALILIPIHSIIMPVDTPQLKDYRFSLYTFNVLFKNDVVKLAFNARQIDQFHHYFERIE